MADEDYLHKLEKEGIELRERNAQMSTALAATSFQAGEDRNLIEFQLDHSDILAQIEHFLRGDYIDIDEKGNEDWKKQTDTDLILFNQYGVISLMSIINNYFNKSTVLSRYTEERINEILADLGDELTIFLFCNYEKMGMDTQFKKTRFGMTVLTILHSIESAYRRAIGGKTSEDINTSKIFTQSDLMGAGRTQGMMSLPTKKKFNLFHPGTW